MAISCPGNRRRRTEKCRKSQDGEVYFFQKLCNVKIHTFFFRYICIIHRNIYIYICIENMCMCAFVSVCVSPFFVLYIIIVSVVMHQPPSGGPSSKCPSQFIAGSSYVKLCKSPRCQFCLLSSQHLLGIQSVYIYI